MNDPIAASEAAISRALRRLHAAPEDGEHHPDCPENPDNDHMVDDEDHVRSCRCPELKAADAESYREMREDR